MRVTPTALLACLAGLQLPSQTDPAATLERPANHLQIAQLLDWESVSSPRISPDGQHVVFTRRWNDRLADRRQSELWRVRIDGSRLTQLGDGADPRWSPDGTRLAFVREGEPGGAQIHVMWLDTREVTQVTRVDQSPSSLRWSPDGTRIAFSAQVPSSADGLKIDMPKPPKGAKWAPPPRIVTRLAYRRDRSGYRPDGFRHLFVVDAAGGTPRQITHGDFDHGPPRWTPDGTRLVFDGLRAEDADWQIRESEIYAIEIDSGTVHQLTRREGPDRSPEVSPDGQWIVYTGYDKNRDTYNVASLHLMRADGSDARVLVGDLDRALGGLHWAPDGSGVFFTVQDQGTRDAYHAAVDGSLTRVTRGQHQFSCTGVGPRGLLVGTWTDPHHETDIAIAELGGDPTPRRLTRVNDDLLEHVQLGDVEEVRYRSTDDLEIQGWIVKPPDFDPAQKYPLILQIHGGPHSMYGWRFSFERHNHAAAGYVVLYTNPRGSVGYGKEFGNAIDNAYPGRDYDDLMAGVDTVIARGYIDEDRLFVYGGSGGGVLTAWIVGKTDRFRAAVSMFPVTNWISFVGTTDGPYWYTNFDKLPWEDPTEHWQRSPLRLVGNVKTPTLLITGELDLRTPMSQTEEYYQALKLRKVETAMIRVPDEYHGAAGRRVSNQLRRILYVRSWFEKYGSGPGQSSDSAVEAGFAPGR